MTCRKVEMYVTTLNLRLSPDIYLRINVYDMNLNDNLPSSSIVFLWVTFTVTCNSS